MAEFSAFTEQLDSPMYVVTAASPGGRGGCLVGFASQCSIDPPRFVVWLSTANHTYRVARAAEHLTVHLLHRGGPGDGRAVRRGDGRPDGQVRRAVLAARRRRQPRPGQPLHVVHGADPRADRGR
ncbi:hypothetical protein GCM10019017_11360 [Streptomyces showdoensis]